MRLHDVAMSDEYFIKRKLAPNVDFWYGFAYCTPVLPFIFNDLKLNPCRSGLIYRAMGKQRFSGIVSRWIDCNSFYL